MIDFKRIGGINEDITDTVYGWRYCLCISECEHIAEKLDGSLYGENGGYGDATGYYCPYENCCPFDSEELDSCETYKCKPAVFKDVVSQIMINECGLHIFTENCCMLGKLGRNMFLSKEEAEDALRDKLIDNI